MSNKSIDYYSKYLKYKKKYLDLKGGAMPALQGKVTSGYPGQVMDSGVTIEKLIKMKNWLNNTVQSEFPRYEKPAGTLNEPPKNIVGIYFTEDNKGLVLMWNVWYPEWNCTSPTGALGTLPAYCGAVELGAPPSDSDELTVVKCNEIIANNIAGLDFDLRAGRLETTTELVINTVLAELTAFISNADLDPAGGLGLDKTFVAKFVQDLQAAGITNEQRLTIVKNKQNHIQRVKTIIGGPPHNNQDKFQLQILEVLKELLDVYEASLQGAIGLETDNINLTKELEELVKEKEDIKNINMALNYKNTDTEAQVKKYVEKQKNVNNVLKRLVGYFEKNPYQVKSGNSWYPSLNLNR